MRPRCGSFRPGLCLNLHGLSRNSQGGPAAGTIRSSKRFRNRSGPARSFAKRRVTERAINLRSRKRFVMGTPKAGWTTARQSAKCRKGYGVMPVPRRALSAQPIETLVGPR